MARLEGTNDACTLGAMKNANRAGRAETLL